MNYQLEKGEVLTVVAAPTMEAIAVVAGEVWLTRNDDRADYCLEAGAVHPLGTAGKVVIEALQSAVVSVVWREATAALRVAVDRVESYRCVGQTL